MRCPETPDQITIAFNNYLPYFWVDEDNDIDKNTIGGRNQ